MLRTISKLFTAFWPLGLFAFFVLIVLSFTNIEPEQIAQIFGAVVIGCAALAWLIVDWVKPSEDRVKSALREMSELLAPYEGMKLKDMPPEIQAEVHRRLGWGPEPVKKPVQELGQKPAPDSPQQA